jgi:hypothetical protein
MVVLVVLVLLVSFSDITFIDVDNLLLFLLLANVLTLGVLMVKHVDVDMMELRMSSDDDSLIFIVVSVYYCWLFVVNGY